MPGENVARPVRVARPARAGPPRVPEPGPAAPPAADRPPSRRRENRGATQRAVRLSILYAGGIAAVYVFLAALSRTQSAGGSSGTTEAILLAGLLAVVLAAVGVVFALGAAPRSVEVGETETIVVGRFGRTYRFPGRSRLRTTVLERFPAGFLTPVALESVEIVGGSTRRSFLLDEGILEEPDPRAASEDAAPV